MSGGNIAIIDPAIAGPQGLTPALPDPVNIFRPSWITCLLSDCIIINGQRYWLHM